MKKLIISFLVYLGRAVLIYLGTLVVVSFCQLIYNNSILPESKIIWTAYGMTALFMGAVVLAGLTWQTYFANRN